MPVGGGLNVSLCTLFPLPVRLIHVHSLVQVQFEVQEVRPFHAVVDFYSQGMPPPPPWACLSYEYYAQGSDLSQLSA